MKYIIACNWKMFPSDLATAKKTVALHKKLALKKNTKIISLPPALLFGSLVQKTGSLVYGVQDICEEKEGAFTGETSAKLVAQLGGQYTIVGHSERRQRQVERDALVSKKAGQAIQSGLIPIICFGESVRDEKGLYIDEIKKQLLESLVMVQENKLSKILLAYEPVWAIGKNAARPITTEELFSTMILIKKILTERYGKEIAGKIKILYGGSVKGSNAAELLKVPGLAGFLVGGATHSADDLTAIVAAAQ